MSIQVLQSHSFQSHSFQSCHRMPSDYTTQDGVNTYRYPLVCIHLSVSTLQKRLSIRSLFSDLAVGMAIGEGPHMQPQSCQDHRLTSRNMTHLRVNTSMSTRDSKQHSCDQQTALRHSVMQHGQHQLEEECHGYSATSSTLYCILLRIHIPTNTHSYE